jgi:SAM-dependent methyltransferase
MQRVGRIEDPDIAVAYDGIGRHSRARIERLLPADWSWEGRRVLDFGCGAGRTLRHFLDEAEHAEFHGCDIDDRSIAWLSEHLSPPLHVFQNGESPGLPRPDGFFDLAYALSVFTHLGDHWADWLLELRRVLKPDGLFVATFLNEAHWEIYGRGAWDEDRVGMNVIRKWNPWDEGGRSSSTPSGGFASIGAARSTLCFSSDTTRPRRREGRARRCCVAGRSLSIPRNSCD